MQLSHVPISNTVTHIKQTVQSCTQQAFNLVFLCFFGIVLFLLVLISSMVGFVYMSEITYFVSLIKFSICLRLWICLLYVLSMILNIFTDIIYCQMQLCVSPCFCSGSTFHVRVAVENVHVHNALLNFVICCLP